MFFFIAFWATVLMAVLKYIGYITVGWLIIFSPMIAMTVGVLLVGVVAALVGAVVAFFHSKERRF